MKSQEGRGRKFINLKSIGLTNLVTFCKCDYTKTHEKLEPHIHQDSFELCYFYRGCQEYWVEDMPYKISSGDIFITKPNELHSSGESYEQKSGLFYFIFELTPKTRNFMDLDIETTQFIKETLFNIGQHQYKGNTKLKQIMEQIIEVYNKKEIMWRNRLYGLFIELFYELIQILSNKRNEQVVEDSSISKALSYIDENICSEISVDQLSQMSFLSSVQFATVFKKSTGFSPHDYILRGKIQLAQEMLSYTQLSITEVAYLLGFSSSQYFATVFKRYTGKKATEYRKSD